MLSMLNRRKEYKAKNQTCTSKFMPHYNRPYEIVNVHTDTSTITLNMPNAPNLFPTFHTSNIKPCNEKDNHKYPI